MLAFCVMVQDRRARRAREAGDLLRAAVAAARAQAILLALEEADAGLCAGCSAVVVVDVGRGLARCGCGVPVDASG